MRNALGNSKPTLRFKLKFESEGFDNMLYTSLPATNSGIYPCKLGRAILARFEFGMIVQGSPDYETLEPEATWTADLRPWGEKYLPQDETVRCKVSTVDTLDRITLDISADKDSYLVAYTTDEDEFPFKEGDIILMPLRIAKCYDTDNWGLMPIGVHIDENTIIAEVHKVE